MIQVYISNWEPKNVKGFESLMCVGGAPTAIFAVARCKPEMTSQQVLVDLLFQNRGRVTCQPENHWIFCLA